MSNNLCIYNEKWIENISIILKAEERGKLKLIEAKKRRRELLRKAKDASEIEMKIINKNLKIKFDKEIAKLMSSWNKEMFQKKKERIVQIKKIKKEVLPNYPRAISFLFNKVIQIEVDEMAREIRQRLYFSNLPYFK